MLANSQHTSGLLKIAGLLEEGGVCGVPTDTVYALAASCKNPQAIERIYNIKVRNDTRCCCWTCDVQGTNMIRSNSAFAFSETQTLPFQERPAEKPISICISSIKQLASSEPPFSPLLWEFMRNVYPGGISCIVSKGDWLTRLGKQDMTATTAHP